MHRDSGSASGPSRREAQVEVLRIRLVDAGPEVDIAHVEAAPGCPLRNRSIEPVVAHDVAGQRAAEGEIGELAIKVVEFAFGQSPDLHSQVVVKQFLLV